MLTIGQQLYNLRERDLQTLLLEPFNWEQAGAFGIGTGLITLVSPTIPRDRSLYLEAVMVEASVDPGASVYRLLGQWAPDPVSLLGIVHFMRQGVDPGVPLLWDGGTGGGGTNGALVRNPKMLLPPGGELRIFMQRGPALGAPGVVNVNLYGWLIPAADIGRLS